MRTFCTRGYREAGPVEKVSVGETLLPRTIDTEIVLKKGRQPQLSLLFVISHYQVWSIAAIYCISVRCSPLMTFTLLLPERRSKESK